MARDRISLDELIHFSPKQLEARTQALKYRYVLYGGAMAGGKSYWLRWMLVYFLIRWAKKGFLKVEVALFCEDYPTLKDRQLSKIGAEFPTWLGSMHGDHAVHGRCYILDEEYGGGIIKFRNLDDPSKYQSAEFAAIAVEEITKNQEAVFDDLRNRLRWSGIADVKFIAATNPGGIGHAWVKKRWLDKKFDDHEQEADQFFYVRALAADNPHIDKGYLKQLESLPLDKRRAYLEGDWDIFKGQYFTEWRREIHVCKPFDIPSDWKKFCALDYGYAAPASIGWYAIDPDGFLYRYKELYITGRTGTQLGEDWVMMTRPDEKIQYITCDPSFWNKKGEDDGALSTAEKFQARIVELLRSSDRHAPPLVKANNDRIVGWREMHEWLKPVSVEGEVTSKFKVFSTCLEFLRTFPSLVHDTHNPEDVDSDGEDHAGDEARYAVMSRPSPSKTQEQIASIEFKKMLKKRGKSAMNNKPTVFL